MRNETFRIGSPKPLKSLGALNQPFRGFLCYQGLEADFVSPRSRQALAGRFRLVSAPAPRAPHRGGRTALHLVDFVADPLECGLERQAIGREAVEMLEDADVRIGRGGLAG